MSEKLQPRADLDLNTAVTLARQHKEVKQQLQQQRGASVDAMNRRQRGGDSQPSLYKQKSEDRGSSCCKCGTVHKRYACPAKV